MSISFMKTSPTIFFALLTILFFIKMPLWGCGCFFPPGWDRLNDPIKQGLKESEFVGIVKVLYIKTDIISAIQPRNARGTGVFITVEIEKTWKGITSGNLTVYGYMNTSSCPVYTIAWYDINRSRIQADTAVRHILFLRTEPENNRLYFCDGGCVINSGNNWNPAYERRIDSLAALPGALTAIGQNEKSLLEVFQHPNPTSHQSVLTFTLPEATWVTIELYNAFGVRLPDVQESFLAAGTHSRAVNLSEFPPGVYFCRLRTTKNAITKKIIKMQ